ncbi:hypothetical protein LguiA_030335 [Lonicera macranthoides]
MLTMIQIGRVRWPFTRVKSFVSPGKDVFCFVYLAIFYISSFPLSYSITFVGGNGDDNLILGLCVDRVSHDERITLTLGDEEKEVFPCCILLRVIVDGKLPMFHFCSAAGVLSPPPDIVFAISDGDEDTYPSESGLTEISSSAEERVEKVVSRLQ